MIPESCDSLVHLIDKHRSGEPIGIYSVCSANGWVIRAAMEQARSDDSLLLIEATCNQVNQFGGYTGQTPAQFVEETQILADEFGFPQYRLLLGGDHLGPSVWQGEPAGQAMKKSRELVKQYVESGFIKIHLDTSMSCSDDPVPLPEEVVAERSADLCAVAEIVKGESSPIYIVGTEVPTPGGALESHYELQVTQPEDVISTIENTQNAFRSNQLDRAWERVIGVVVQPGVEFGNELIIEYDRKKAEKLSKVIETYHGLVYEAHSTDYQRRISLRELVADHFCILKVGPALTFAFRESIFALADIEDELGTVFGNLVPSNIRKTLERVMFRHPEHWQQYDSGQIARQAFERKYGFSDRIRYYWQYPEIQESLKNLLVNLNKVDIPLSLLSQYLPVEYDAVRSGSIENKPGEMIQNKIRSVLNDYRFACGL